MSQSRAHSLIESIVNTGVGLAVNVAATAYILPVFGVVLSLRENIIATVVMTIVSVARQYVIRRAFNIGGRKDLAEATAVIERMMLVCPGGVVKDEARAWLQSRKT